MTDYSDHPTVYFYTYPDHYYTDTQVMFSTAPNTTMYKQSLENPSRVESSYGRDVVHNIVFGKLNPDGIFSYIEPDFENVEDFIGCTSTRW